MHSPIIKDREDAAQELVTTLQMHGKRVGAKLAEIFEPMLEEGEALPDYVLLQQLMARSVRTALADLRAADEAYRAVVAQIEEEPERGAELDPFLRARSAKTEAERQQAIEAFDETYGGFCQMLEALYILAGEDEIADLLRPRALTGDGEWPETVLAEASVPDPAESDEEDQVQRRILSRKAKRPGLSQWAGVRIFRRRHR